MRTIAEIRATGAAWITESELEWVCEQFETLRAALEEVVDESATSDFIEVARTALAKVSSPEECQ